MIVTGTASRSHWLASIAIEAGFPGAESLPPGASSSEIWLAICQAGQLSEQELARTVARHFDLPMAKVWRRTTS
jgi:hypothetical protein